MWYGKNSDDLSTKPEFPEASKNSIDLYGENLATDI